MHDSMIRLYAEMRSRNHPIEGPSALARLLNESAQTVKNWESRGVSEGGALKAQMVAAIDANYVLTGIKSPLLATEPDHAKPYLTVQPGAPGTQGTGCITLAHVRGSCGGGSIDPNAHEIRTSTLVKESTWFQRYGVEPSDLFAIYADGDSMADFIVDGDIVIFNRKVTQLISGKIYALNTPDGLRIKRVHKRTDGGITLASDNLNKSRFPDELFTPEHSETLQIAGGFVYRQGGN